MISVRLVERKWFQWELRRERVITVALPFGLMPSRVATVVKNPSRGSSTRSSGGFSVTARGCTWTRNRIHGRCSVTPEIEDKMRSLKEQTFNSSFAGQARTVWEAGHQIHQVVIPLITAARTVSGILSGSTSAQGGMKTTANSGHNFELQSIEREGWRLEHVNAVFQETGSVSRDKLLSSGQVESVVGSVLMVYTFRRTAKGAV